MSNISNNKSKTLGVPMIHPRYLKFLPLVLVGILEITFRMHITFPSNIANLFFFVSMIVVYAGVYYFTCTSTFMKKYEEKYYQKTIKNESFS